ncbi:MAG: hypothetical protein Tsb002_04350 [Wenzhouxiangellaceae bacterium]
MLSVDKHCFCPVFAHSSHRLSQAFDFKRFILFAIKLDAVAGFGINPASEYGRLNPAGEFSDEC